MKTLNFLIRRKLLASIVLLGVARSITLGAAAATKVGTPRKILVFGGSGQLGSQIVRALLAAGHDVTVFIRPTSDRSRLANLTVHYVEGDVTVEADVRRAMQATRFDVVIDALGRSGANVSFLRSAVRTSPSGQPPPEYDNSFCTVRSAPGKAKTLIPQSAMSRCEPCLPPKKPAKTPSSAPA